MLRFCSFCAVMLVLLSALAVRAPAKEKEKDKDITKSIFANRTGANKAKALNAFGATDESEQADARSAHQKPGRKQKLEFGRQLARPERPVCPQRRSGCVLSDECCVRSV